MHPLALGDLSVALEASARVENATLKEHSGLSRCAGAIVTSEYWDFNWQHKAT